MGLQIAPVKTKQLALFDMGGDAPVHEIPEGGVSGVPTSARTVSQEVIDQVLCTGGSIELLIFKVIRPADGIMADDLLFHRVAHPAVGPILQVAVGRGVAGKGQKCAVRADG